MIAPFAGLAAAAQTSRSWWQMVPDKVVACAIAAVVLLLISLLLRGVLKVITLLLVLVLAAGAFWFIRDGWGGHAGLLPREWSALATKTLDSPVARDAWQSLQEELSHLSEAARARLAAGTDDARHSLVGKLDARAQKLAKEGKAAEAEQVSRLATLIEGQK